MGAFLVLASAPFDGNSIASIPAPCSIQPVQVSTDKPKHSPQQIASGLAINQGTSKEYTAWLRENAANFGFDSAAITDRTVLVYVRGMEVDRAEFARQANESVTAQMSPAELIRQVRSEGGAMNE